MNAETLRKPALPVVLVRPFRLLSVAARAVKMRALGGLVAIVCLAAWTGAQAGYTGLYVFGDSLSDTGNNAFVYDVVGASQGIPPGTLRESLPTPDNSFIPTYPYANSNVYSNGPVWVDTFAFTLGLNATASNLGGTNYAYAGARVGPLSQPDPLVDFPNYFPPSVTTQVATFLGQYNYQAPSNALYVVGGGGNDARDIIAAAGNILAGGGTINDALPGILSGAQSYAADVDTMVNALEAAGAKDIIVWNAPNAGLGPAILAQGAGELGTLVTQLMNLSLLTALNDDIANGVRIFDLFGFATNVASDPAAFGLVDAANACSASANILACQQNLYQYFFWDGIHPTAAGHRLLAGAMVASVPEPPTLALLALALFAIIAIRKRQSI